MELLAESDFLVGRRVLYPRAIDAQGDSARRGSGLRKSRFRKGKRSRSGARGRPAHGRPGTPSAHPYDVVRRAETRHSCAPRDEFESTRAIRPPCASGSVSRWSAGRIRDRDPRSTCRDGVETSDREEELASSAVRVLVDKRLGNGFASPRDSGPRHASHSSPDPDLPSASRAATSSCSRASRARRTRRRTRLRCRARRPGRAEARSRTRALAAQRILRMP